MVVLQAGSGRAAFDCAHRVDEVEGRALVGVGVASVVISTVDLEPATCTSPARNIATAIRLIWLSSRRRGSLPAMTSRTGGGVGSGPLYEHTPAGERAANEDVVIPDHRRDTPAEVPEDNAGKHPTGEDQAEINREDDPPG